MAVFRWRHAWDQFQSLEHEMDRLLQGVNLTLQHVRHGRRFPHVNLYELDDEYLLTAELPGTAVDDLDLTVADGVLTIKGTRESDGVSAERFRRQERFQGAWLRSMNLPDRVQEAGMTAELRDGILKVHLPKAPATTPRQIPVSDGND